MKTWEHDIKSILEGISAGDELAFERLFIQFKDRVYEIAMRYTDHAPEISEEIVQDVFLKVWLKKAELTSIQDIEHWLYTVAKRLSFDVMRGIALRRRTKGELAHQEAINGLNTIGEQFSDANLRTVDAETKRLIAEVAAMLTPQQRYAMQLIKEEGMSREEAAAAMGISPNTIKMHLLTGSRTMRAQLVFKGVIIPSVLAAYPVFAR